MTGPHTLLHEVFAFIYVYIYIYIYILIDLNSMGKSLIRETGVVCFMGKQ